MQARRAALLKLNESYDGLGDAMATDPTEIPVDFLRAQPLLAVQMAALVVAPGRMQEVVRVASSRTKEFPTAADAIDELIRIMQEEVIEQLLELQEAGQQAAAQERSSGKTGAQRLSSQVEKGPVAGSLEYLTPSADGVPGSPKPAGTADKQAELTAGRVSARVGRTPGVQQQPLARQLLLGAAQAKEAEQVAAQPEQDLASGLKAGSADVSEAWAGALANSGLETAGAGHGGEKEQIPPPNGAGGEGQLLQFFQNMMAQQQEQHAQQMLLLRKETADQIGRLVEEHKTELAEQQSQMEELKSKPTIKSMDEDEDLNKVFPPHYDGTTVTTLPSGETVTHYTPWTSGRQDKSDPKGNIPRILDLRGSEMYEELAKNDKRTARFHEYQTHYSVCSFLFDIQQYLTDMMPVLMDSETTAEERGVVLDGLYNGISGVYGVASRRVSVIELLTRRDSPTAKPEEKERDQALINYMERKCAGFERFLGSASGIDDNFKMYMQSFDEQMETALHKRLVRNAGEAAAKSAQGSGSSSSAGATRRRGQTAKVTVTTTGGSVSGSAAAGAASAGGKR